MLSRSSSSSRAASAACCALASAATAPSCASSSPASSVASVAAARAIAASSRAVAKAVACVSCVRCRRCARCCLRWRGRICKSTPYQFLGALHRLAQIGFETGTCFARLCCRRFARRALRLERRQPLELGLVRLRAHACNRTKVSRYKSRAQNRNVRFLARGAPAVRRQTWRRGSCSSCRAPPAARCGRTGA